MKDLMLSLRTELIKIKYSFTLWLVILGAAFIPAFFLLHHLYDWKEYLPKAGENPWNEYFRKGFNGVQFTFLPLLLVLLSALLLNIEHQSNTWKHTFVLPISKAKIYWSKYLLLIGLVILFYGLLLVFFFSGGLLLSLRKSNFNFLNYPPSYFYNSVSSGVGAYVFRSFISSLGIIAIHFWLSFRLKNMFINIGIGLAGVVIAISMYIGHWASMVIFPYSFPVLMCNYTPEAYHFLSDFQINSLICFVVISIFSYLDFTKRFNG